MPVDDDENVEGVDELDPDPVCPDEDGDDSIHAAEMPDG